MAGLHAHLTLKEDVEVFIDDLIVGKNRVPIVKVSFFLVNIALEDLVNIGHDRSVFLLSLELGQVITDLIAIPDLGQSDLVDDLFAFADQVLHLCLGLLLTATAKADWCDTEASKVRMIVLGQQFDLLLR